MKQHDIIFSSISDRKVTFSKEFSSLFPELSNLISKASVVDFTINSNRRFRQYIWTKKDGSTNGWLCNLEHCTPQGRNIIEEHELLSKSVGSIIECWTSDEDAKVETFIDNNNFTFSLVDTTKGIAGWEDNYLELCEEESISPLDINDFVTFALEANGNITFYNYKTKEVFYYAHDGYYAFDISLVDKQPEYSIHTIDGVSTFVDYVEQLAKQWLAIVR